MSWYCIFLVPVNRLAGMKAKNGDENNGSMDNVTSFWVIKKTPSQANVSLRGAPMIFFRGGGAKNVPCIVASRV